MAKSPDTKAKAKIEELEAIPVTGNDEVAAAVSFEGRIIVITRQGLVFNVEVIHGR